MRIVLDTNVVLSALLWRGSPYQLLQTIRQREDIKLFSSGLLLEELAKVLTRPVPAKRLALFNTTAAQMLADYAEVADLVTPIGAPRVIVEDPDDDHVIAAAIAAGADIIASGDRHLLSLRTYRQIRILSPADSLALISGRWHNGAVARWWVTRRFASLTHPTFLFFIRPPKKIPAFAGMTEGVGNDGRGGE